MIQLLVKLIFGMIILFFVTTYFVINANNKLIILKRYELLFNYKYAAPFVAINKNETPEYFYDMLEYPILNLILF